MAGGGGQMGRPGAGAPRPGPGPQQGHHGSHGGYDGHGDHAAGQGGAGGGPPHKTSTQGSGGLKPPKQHGSGPKTFEEMGVPQAGKENDCVSTFPALPFLPLLGFRCGKGGATMGGIMG